MIGIIIISIIAISCLIVYSSSPKCEVIICDEENDLIPGVTLYVNGHKAKLNNDNTYTVAQGADCEIYDQNDLYERFTIGKNVDAYKHIIGNSKYQHEKKKALEEQVQAWASKYTTEVLNEITTHQTKMSHEEVVNLFSSWVMSYLSKFKYYVVGYDVPDDKVQNYAWMVKIKKFKYNWGIIFAILFQASNGEFYLKLSNTSFSVGDVEANEIKDFTKKTTRQAVYEDLRWSYSAWLQEMILKLKENNLDGYSQDTLNNLCKFFELNIK
jgi:hypothetical protein